MEISSHPSRSNCEGWGTRLSSVPLKPKEGLNGAPAGAADFYSAGIM